MMKRSIRSSGFTLVELSIVLVIIGLIVGGILTGQDLIRAAAERAQITQIEKFNSAVNTFRGKYNGLPGDLNATDAANFGFVARGQYAGEGDGNGVVEGIYADAPASSCGACEGTGETGVFWVDLAKAKLIEGGFSSAAENGATIGLNTVFAPGFGPYFPAAKISQGSYIFVWSGGIGGGNGLNYFSPVTPSFVSVGLAGYPSLTARQAYDIDTKMDDGLPQSGNVTASWPSSGGYSGVYIGAIGTAATPRTTSTCYDNNAVASGVQQYSILQNNGVGQNCSLAFKFQ